MARLEWPGELVRFLRTMFQRRRGFAWLAVSAVTTLLLGWNLSELLEAFGDGAPYFGRTTNMDKWSNPLPALLVVDIFAIAAILVVRRTLRAHCRQ